MSDLAWKFGLWREPTAVWHRPPDCSSRGGVLAGPKRHGRKRNHQNPGGRAVAHGRGRQLADQATGTLQSGAIVRLGVATVPDGHRVFRNPTEAETVDVIEMI